MQFVVSLRFYDDLHNMSYYIFNTYLHNARTARQILGDVPLIQRSFEGGRVVVDILQINNQRNVGAHTRRAHISSSHCQSQWAYSRFFVSLFDGQSLVIQGMRGRYNAAFRIDREISREFARYQCVNHLAVSRSCKMRRIGYMRDVTFLTDVYVCVLFAFCLCYR